MKILSQMAEDKTQMARRSRKAAGPWIFLIIGLVFLALAAAGCTGKDGAKTGTDLDMETGEDAELRIVTSFYPLYIMTLNIAQYVPGVSVANMTKPYAGCLHDYQMTTDDMKTLEAADILVANGAGMESFLDDVIGQLPELRVIQASDGLELLANESDGESNPHLWVSVSGAIDQVENIAAQLAEADPAHAETYRANAAVYQDKLNTLRQEMHQALDPLPQRQIITFHEAFPYFAREFDLQIVAVVEREPGAQPSAREVAETIDLVRSAGVTAIFAEPQYSTAAAETIAAETGAKVYFLDPAVTGEMNPDAYLETMRANLKTLEEALR